MSPKQEKALILSNEAIMPDTHLMRLSVSISKETKPGQFLMIKCDDTNRRLLRRPISVHLSDPDSVVILFKTIGEGTYWLAQRKPGEALDILGPLGNGFHIDTRWRRLLLIAGGLGIAPIAGLASQAITSGNQVTLLSGASQAGYLYPTKLLPSGLKLVLATDDGSAGRKGMVSDFMQDFIAQADAVFACGPIPMYKTMSVMVSKLCPEKPVQVSLEARMGCGVGGCFSCTINTTNGLKRVCRDGPVFQLNELDWDWLAI